MPAIIVWFVCLLLPLAAAAHSDDLQALETGLAAEGLTTEENQTVLFQIDAVPEDYLRGSLEVKSGRFDLDLVAADGTHIRRFAENAEGRQDFQFVAGHDNLLLRLTGKLPQAAYTLKITHRYGLVEQVAPAPEYQSPTMKRLAEELAAGGTTDSFWHLMQKDGTPLVEPGPDGQKIVTFIARGAKRNIRLWGAPSGDHDELERLGTSDIWFRSYLLPSDTRLSYKLALDVPDFPGTARERRVAILATAQADPLNRHPMPTDASDPFNQSSILELENALAQPWETERGNPEGTLMSFRLASDRLGNQRNIMLYRPANFDPANTENILLFVFDGVEYTTRVRTPLILDNMIAEGAIPPVTAVFITNPDNNARAHELPANPDFADFMALELLPRVLQETGLPIRPERTILTGSSFGGLASATIALRYPELFGNVLSMSGSFWWSPPGTAADIRNMSLDYWPKAMRLSHPASFSAPDCSKRPEDGTSPVFSKRTAISATC